MGVSNEELLKTIRYYQDSLEKYSANDNNYKVLSVIKKLKKLPIATSHLENTGIGRTVNGLRKLGGEVGDAAKALVTRWKEMVVQEDVTKEKTDKESPDREPVISRHDERENSFTDTKHKEKDKSSSHKSGDESERERSKVDKHSNKYKQDHGTINERHTSKAECESDSNSNSEEENDEGKSDSNTHTSESDEESSSSEEENRDRDGRDKNKSNSTSDRSHEKKVIEDVSSKKSKYNNNNSSERHSSKRKRHSSDSDSEQDDHEGKRSKSHSKNHRNDSDEEEYGRNSDKNQTDDYKSSHNRRDDRDKEKSKKQKYERESSSKSHSSKRKRHSSSSSGSDEESYEKIDSKSNAKHRSDSDDDDEDRKHSSKRESDEKRKKHKSSGSKSDRHEPTPTSSKSKSKEKTDKPHDHSSSKSKSSRSEGSSKRELDEDTKSSSKHKRSSHDTETELQEKSKSKHEKESNGHKESKSHSVKHEKRDKKDREREPSKDKHGGSGKDKNSKEEKEAKKEKSSTPSSSKSKDSSKSSSSKNKSSKGKSEVAGTAKIVHGIDSESGASFAEALGMCAPMVYSKSTGGTKKKSTALPSPEKQSRTVSSSVPERMERPEPTVEKYVPNLLKDIPPEPLQINISSLLPEITPNYKPVAFPLDGQSKRILTPDEALSQAISNKNMRTKVYSGNKTKGGEVESLFNICVKILQDNLDAIECTGGVPYIVLKTILEKATPDQLFNLEHYNPYLIEDTDELWRLHCMKEFRTKKREEMETWREMYMRCLDEREAKLNFITANIKESQDKSLPVRTTKLAYIDSVAKPPRNVAKRQARNGIINRVPLKTSTSMKLTALATAGEAGKVAVPNPGSRAVDRSSSSSSAAAIKPKKAPLMAKTLSFLKNRFKR